VPSEELKRLSSWPGEVARSDLSAYFTLSLEDLRWLRAHRGAGERMGLAVQLAALRFLGFIADELGETPGEVARHVAEQIGMAPATFARYAREVDARTRRRHAATVIEHAGWRTCGPGDWASLSQWLTERALEHDTPTILFGQALDQKRRPSSRGAYRDFSFRCSLRAEPRPTGCRPAPGRSRGRSDG
jgi:hypothetical protein